MSEFVGISQEMIWGGLFGGFITLITCWTIGELFANDHSLSPELRKLGYTVLGIMGGVAGAYLAS